MQVLTHPRDGSTADKVSVIVELVDRRGSSSDTAVSSGFDETKNWSTNDSSTFGTATVFKGENWKIKSIKNYNGWNRHSWIELKLIQTFEIDVKECCSQLSRTIEPQSKYLIPKLTVRGNIKLCLEKIISRTRYSRCLTPIACAISNDVTIETTFLTLSNTKVHITASSSISVSLVRTCYQQIFWRIFKGSINRAAPGTWCKPQG